MEKLRFKRITLSDGTKKLERIPDSPEEIERRKEIHKEAYKRKREHRRKLDYNLAIRNGFRSSYEYKKYYNDQLAKRNGFENSYEYQKYCNNQLARRNRFDNYKEYKDDFYKKRGFENFNENRKLKRYQNGENIPMDINKDCSSYLGVYIAESILPELFENPKMMPYGNKGFDAICKRGNKIDVKSSCLCVGKDSSHSDFWYYHINENIVADYFFIIAFDNRKNLNIQYIWLIKGDEPINNKYSINRKLNRFKALSIINNEKSINKYKKYQLDKDKIDKAIKMCNQFKEKHEIKVNMKETKKAEKYHEMQKHELFKELPKKRVVIIKKKK